MTLKARLDAIMLQRADWYQLLLAELAKRLTTTACEVALRPGDTMPDFVLPNAEGELVFSDDLLESGPLVIAFYRGGWCPFCNATLAALQEVLPQIEATGATLVVLSPDTGEYVAALKHRLGLGFQVLSDVDNATGLRFGAVYRVPDDYRAALLSYGMDLQHRQGDGAWLLPLPSTFVVGQDGSILHAKASGDVTDRTEPDTILTLLRALQRKPVSDKAHGVT
jgi:peroxiredoxin